jgi:ppGpp synthetase/RelA/SpoT-type nucleotidyltranferase
VYTDRYRALEPIAQKLETHLADNLASFSRVDQVRVRVKTVSSFCAKARTKSESGGPKYRDPLNQIQDQVGARVVVYFLEDVAAVSKIVEKYYKAIERQTVVPDSVKEFGYEGKHYIFFIPEEFLLQSSVKNYPTFFELQVRTLFQHAWSQLEHGLGYKPSKSVPPQERRKTAFTAAQAWGADRIFQELLDDANPVKTKKKRPV